MDLHAVIINGSGTHGKDEFIKQVRNVWEKNPKRIVVNYSTIDTVKRICQEVWGVDPEEKSDRARQLWSDIKDALIAYDDLPAKEAVGYAYHLKESIGSCGHSKKFLLFIHCREPSEISKIRDGIRTICTSIKTLLVIRPNHTTPNCTKDAPCDIADFNYDEIIVAENKDEIKGKAKEFSRNY